MTYSDWINILSTLITIVSTLFGIWGIYITYFKKRYSGKISYIPIQTVRIYENIVTAFPEVSITHNDEPITQELVYHKAAIINNGMIDISKQMIDEPISLTLKQGKWKEAKIKNSFFKKINIIIENGNQIFLKFKLLRINETIHFETLSTISNAKSLEFEDNMVISHRIAETQKISVLNKITENDISRDRSSLKFYAFINLVLLIGVLFMIGIQIYNVNRTILVKFDNDPNLYIKSSSSGSFIFTSLHSEDIIEINKDTHHKLNNIRFAIFKPDLKDKLIILRTKGVFFPFALFPLLFFVIVVGQWMENRRNEKQLKMIDVR